MSTEFLDPTFDPRQWQPARPLRILLAGYLDFVLFSVFWGLFEFGAEKAYPAAADWPGIAKFAAFAIVEVLLYRLYALSPGTWLLGIRFVPTREFASPVEKSGRELVPVVFNELKARESWLTISLAVFFLDEGAKSLIRWTMWNPPTPFFGVVADETSSAIISLVSGGIELFIALKLFQVNIRAAIVGIPYLAVQLASVVVSWNLWDGWVADMILRRRAYQELPVVPELIERIQALTPETLIAFGALSIILLALTIPRLGSGAAPRNGGAGPG